MSDWTRFAWVEIASRKIPLLFASLSFSPSFVRRVYDISSSSSVPLRILLPKGVLSLSLFLLVNFCVSPRSVFDEF